MAISPRLGRSSQKEQYAVFYKSARVQLLVSSSVALRSLCILKVHKIKIFFGSEFEFWNGGDAIVPLSLRLRGIEFSLV